MLQIDLWKRFVIWGMVALGLLMTLPNGFYSRVEAHNDAVVAIERGADTVENRALVETWPGWMPSSLVNLGLDLRGARPVRASRAGRSRPDPRGSTGAVCRASPGVVAPARGSACRGAAGGCRSRRRGRLAVEGLGGRRPVYDRVAVRVARAGSRAPAIFRSPGQAGSDGLT